MQSNRGGFLLILVGHLVAAALLRLGSPTVNDWLLQIASLVMLATSWNMMASTGLFSLGQSAFWGLGAYAALLFVNGGHPSFAASLLVALAVGGLAGAGLALMTGRLSGLYFAIATLAASEGCRILTVMLSDITGGSVGVFIDAQARPQPATLFLVTIGSSAASVAVAAGLAATPLNFAIRAMRDNEDAAQMLGINPMFCRVLVSVLAGMMAALAGALAGWHGGYLAPEIYFNLDITIKAQIATILGGLYFVAGPPAGALAVVLLSEASRLWLGTLEGASVLIYGVLLVACVLFFSGGLVGSGLVGRGRAARRRRARSA